MSPAMAGSIEASSNILAGYAAMLDDSAAAIWDFAPRSEN